MTSSHIVTILTAKPRWRFILLNKINFPHMSWLAGRPFLVQLWQVVVCSAGLALAFHHWWFMPYIKRHRHGFTLTNVHVWNRWVQFHVSILYYETSARVMVFTVAVNHFEQTAKNVKHPSWIIDHVSLWVLFKILWSACINTLQIITRMLRKI